MTHIAVKNFLTRAEQFICRGANVRHRDDKNAVRHFVAAAHMFLVVAEEYADNAQFDLELRSRENAISCFWRAGYERQARLLFEELKQDNPVFAGDIDSIVLDLQQNHSGWGLY